MTRSIWKGNFLDFSVFYYYNKKNSKTITRNLGMIKIWSRCSVIPKFLVGSTVQIYNGKIFRKLIITREKVGFKFGAFVKTRTKISALKLKKKKKKK